MRLVERSDPRYGREVAIAGQSRWWLPLLFIAIALVLLFVVPLVTSIRLSTVRRHATELSSPALVRVNDLQAALAIETAARSEQAEGGARAAMAESAAVAARTTVEADQRVLDSLVEQIGPAAIAHAESAKVAILAWQREDDQLAAQIHASGTAGHGSVRSTSRDQRWQAVEQALAMTQRLEDELTARTAAERAEIIRLQRINVVVPTALVPLALLALIAVAWAARRTLLLSHEASRGRLEAEAAMASKSALMRGVTHDLKNPLGAARGYADLLADGTLGPVAESQVQVVVRLRNLLTVTLETVNDLVELSRADAGELRIDRHELDVVPIAHEVAADYRAMAAAAGLRLTVDVPQPDGCPCLVFTDGVRVRQVLGNLLSNAMKYTPRDGTVVVRVSVTSDEVLGPVIALDVEDNGPGIPAVLAERVFEEFFRVPTSSGTDGAGVGLAIARRVARLLGGDLRLRNTAGGGATFTLLLPAQPTR
jgi:signal transduction histidine kinase